MAGDLAPFDLEIAFRLFKQILGWTAPKIRDLAAADWWTGLIIAAHAPAGDLPWSISGPSASLRKAAEDCQ